jgi:kynurenine formamidase
MGDRIVDVSCETYSGLAHFVHPPLTVIDYHQRTWNHLAFQPPSQGFDTKFLMMIDHYGTHVDAPSHIHPDGVSVEKIPVEDLMGDAVLLDVSDRPADTVITPALLEAALKKRGTEMRPGDIALIRAWPKGWLEEGFYQCRGINGEATDWLIERGVKAVGIDIATLDDLLPCDPTRPAHVRLLKRNIPIMENFTNLEAIRAPRFHFIGLPLKIRGLTASPIRAVAIE